MYSDTKFTSEQLVLIEALQQQSDKIFDLSAAQLLTKAEEMISLAVLIGLKEDTSPLAIIIAEAATAYVIASAALEATEDMTTRVMNEKKAASARGEIQ